MTAAEKTREDYVLSAHCGTMVDIERSRQVRKHQTASNQTTLTTKEVGCG